MKDTRKRVAPGIVRVESGRTRHVTWEAKWAWQDAQGQRRYGSKRCATRDEAEHARAAALTKLREGTYQALSRETLAQYAARWMDRMQATKWETSTAYIRRRQWTLHLAPRVGGLRLTALTRDHCQRVVDELVAQELAARSVQTITALLAAMLKAAVVDGLIPRNPAQALTLPADDAAPPAIWSAAQVRCFLDRTTKDPCHALYVLLATTGLRLGEALALRWAHVDLDAGLLHVTDTVRRQLDGNLVPAPRTKTHKNRDLPLTAECIAALRAHKERQATLRRGTKRWDIRGYVFTVRDGRPMQQRTARAHLEAAIVACGLPRITPHGFRHSLATMLMEAGVPDRAIQDLLGHSAIATTMGMYAHVTDRLRGAARDTLEAVLSSTTEVAQEGQ